MSQTQTDVQGEQEHASVKTYILIAVVLTLVTIAEVGTYYLEWFNRPENHTLLVVTLVLMSSVKFFIVVGWYMHLKYDARIFRRFFLTGLIPAAVILSAMYLLFSYHPFETWPK